MQPLHIEKPIRREQLAVMPRPSPQRCHVRPVPQLSIVERHAWECADLRVHTVLCVEQMHVLRMVGLHAHEKTLLVLEPRRNLGQNRRRQLLRVSDENTLRAAIFQRNQRAEFNRLCRLVNHNCLKLDAQVLEHLMTTSAERRADDMCTIDDLLLDAPSRQVRVSSSRVVLVSGTIDFLTQLRLLLLQQVEFALQFRRCRQTLCSALIQSRPHVFKRRIRSLMLHVDLLQVSLARILVLVLIQPAIHQLVQGHVQHVGIDRIAPSQPNHRQLLVPAVDRLHAVLKTHHQLVHGCVTRCTHQQFLRRRRASRWSSTTGTRRSRDCHPLVTTRKSTCQQRSHQCRNSLRLSRSRRTLDKREGVIVHRRLDGLGLCGIESVVVCNGPENGIRILQNRRWLRPDDFVTQIVVLQGHQRTVFTLKRRQRGDLRSPDGPIWRQRIDERVPRDHTVRNLHGTFLLVDARNPRETVRSRRVAGRRL